MILLNTLGLSREMTWNNRNNDYYWSLRSRSTNPNAKPLNEKEKNDLRLLEITKHYEQVLIHKMALQRLDSEGVCRDVNI